MCTFKETHKFRLRCVCGTHYHQTVPTFLFANNLQSTHINCCADDLFSFSPSLSEVNFATFVTSSSLIGNRLGTSTVLKVSACVLCCACLREIPPSPVSCVCVCALPKKSIFNFFAHNHIVDIVFISFVRALWSLSTRLSQPVPSSSSFVPDNLLPNPKQSKTKEKENTATTTTTTTTATTITHKFVWLL